MLELNRKVNRKLFTFCHNESGNHSGNDSGNHHSGRICKSVVSQAFLENEK